MGWRGESGKVRGGVRRGERSGGEEEHDKFYLF